MSLFCRAVCPVLPISDDFYQAKGTRAKQKNFLKKSRKLGATYFVPGVSGKRLNPDVGSKNKQPGFARLRIAKQPHLPRRGAEGRSQT